MKDSLLYRTIRPILNIFTMIYIRPKYIGLKNIPKEGRVILAGIHTSILDPLVLIKSTKRQIHFLAKDELWKGPKKIIFSNLGLIPVNRREKDKFALKEAKKYLENEKIIGIFPEGTTEKGRGLLPFKIGAVKLAKDTNTKIVPFVIKGSYKPFKRVTIIFDKPIIIKKDNLDIENKKLRDIIIKIQKEA